MRALFQAAPYLGFMLAQQIVDELLARIIPNPLGWVHQTQGRRRDHRLLDRHVRVAHGDIQVGVRVPPVTEGAARQPRQAARMTVRERNYETIWRRVRKPIHAVRAEIVILPLFAVRHDRRACGFKPFNGVSNGIFIESSQVGILTVALSDLFDQIKGPWDTPDWLGGYRDWRKLGHAYCLAQSIIYLSAVNNKRSGTFPISSGNCA